MYDVCAFNAYELLYLDRDEFCVNLLTYTYSMSSMHHPHMAYLMQYGFQAYDLPKSE